MFEAGGTLWGAGDNNHQQLGEDNTRNHSKPIRILDSVQAVASGSGHSMMLKTDGSLWMVGFDGGGQLGDGGNINRKTPFPLRSGICAISAGSFHRSEERRVGKEGVSTCRSRWSPYH